MDVNRRKLSLVLGVMSFIAIMNSCKREAEQTTDDELFEMAQSTSGFTWFKNSDELLDKSSGTGHSQPFLRTRYNETAALSLDSEGRIKETATFAEGSLIVKELFTDESTLDRYAMLYKKSDSPDADANGWVWGYIDADGGVAFSATKKGSSCTSCHSQSGSIDYMLMNKFFP